MNKERRHANKVAKRAKKRKGFEATSRAKQRHDQIKRTEQTNAMRYVKLIKRMQREGQLEKVS